MVSLLSEFDFELCSRTSQLVIGINIQGAGQWGVLWLQLVKVSFAHAKLDKKRNPLFVLLPIQFKMASYSSFLPKTS